MSWEQRVARLIVDTLKDGKALNIWDLLDKCGIPETDEGIRQFTQGLHWARMNLCRPLKREIVTDRSENYYFMPRSGEWQPLIFDWLPTFTKDRYTRAETAMEMLEVWRLNHGGQVEPKVWKRVNRLIRKHRESRDAEADLIDELAEIAEKAS